MDGAGGGSYITQNEELLLKESVSHKNIYLQRGERWERREREIGTWEQPGAGECKIQIMSDS